MQEIYTCLIIDDDNFSRETLEDIIDDIPNLHILKSISESSLAIKHIVTLQPNIVFLDINMPKKSGIDVQKEISSLKIDSKVIFTTAHEEYVLEAFQNKAFDYLLKPVKKTDLLEILNRIIHLDLKTISSEHNKKIQTDSKEKIIIKNGYSTLILKPENILYIKADGGYSNIYLTKGKVETISCNIGKLEKLFPENIFIKISRSAIINIKYLNKIDRLKKILTLLSDKQEIKLKISREKLYDLEEKINNR